MTTEDPFQVRDRCARYHHFPLLRGVVDNFAGGPSVGSCGVFRGAVEVVGCSPVPGTVARSIEVI